MEDNIGQIIAFVIGIIFLIINGVAKINSKNNKTQTTNKNLPIITNFEDYFLNSNQNIENNTILEKIPSNSYEYDFNSNYEFTNYEHYNSQPELSENVSLEEINIEEDNLETKNINYEEKTKNFEKEEFSIEKSFFETDISKIIMYAEIIKRPNF